MLDAISIFAASNNCSGSFFGLHSWWYYLPQSDFSNSCKDIVSFNVLQGSEIPLILMAIVDDLLRIAGIVAVAFVIYGGIQYISSQGNAEKTARAQSTVLNALTGLAITLIAVAFVAFVGNRLGG